jgi:hypothetical protein
MDLEARYALVQKEGSRLRELALREAAFGEHVLSADSVEPYKHGLRATLTGATSYYLDVLHITRIEDRPLPA